MTKKILALLICVFALIGLNAQTDKMRIVVFDLTPKSQEVTADSSMLSEMLRNEFIKTNRFEVVSREQTARIMSEAEFQAGGITSEAGAIQIGKMLNVKRAIVGSVGTLGGTVFVTVQLFDLESGRFITAESMEAPTMKDIVSRMKNTVAVLTNAAYKAEGIVSAEPIQPAQPAAAQTTPAAKPAKPVKPVKSPVSPAEPRGGPTLVNIIGYASAAAGIGTIALGYFVFDKRAAAAYDAALNAKTAYDSATTGADFTALWTAYQESLASIAPPKMTRTICYVAGGILGAGGIVLALLPPPRAAQVLTDKGWTLAMAPNGMTVAFHY